MKQYMNPKELNACEEIQLAGLQNILNNHT